MPRFSDDVDFFDPPGFFREALAERNAIGVPTGPDPFLRGAARSPRPALSAGVSAILRDSLSNSEFQDSLLESPRTFETSRDFRPMAPLSGPMRPSIQSNLPQWNRSSDRRRFSPPDSGAWPSNLYGASARVFVDSSARRKFGPTTLICVDRKVRREVLFAKRKHGAHHRKKRRSWTSNIGC